MFPDFSFLSAISFARVRVTFEALDKIVLSAYKGSAFRGCLGDALKRNVCIFPGKPCDNCPEKYICPFSILFNSYAHPDHDNSAKFPKTPHPYIICPVEFEKKDFEAGETFGMEITLIGAAIELFPILTRCLFTMGTTGIGSTRGRFIPVGLESFSIENNYYQIPFNGKPSVISFDKLDLLKQCNSITIDFETPLRLKEKKKLLRTAPEFDFFVEILSQRMALLAHFHCGSYWVETSDWLKSAYDIQISDEKLHWVEWTRYSGTEDITMNFDGNVGKITYIGDLSSWLPVLVAGKLLHVGSTTTFGMGKYNLVCNE